MQHFYFSITSMEHLLQNKLLQGGLSDTAFYPLEVMLDEWQGANT